MHQALDRQQPSARFRPQLREIPLWRRYETSGGGENIRQGTSRDDRPRPQASRAPIPRDLPPRARDERRAGDLLRDGGALVRGGNAPDAPRGLDIPVEMAVPAGPGALGEPGPSLVDQGLTGAEVPGDGELPAAPVAEPRDGAGEWPTVDLLGDHLHDARPADGHRPDEDRPAAAVLAGGDLLSGDLPLVSDRAWEWMQPLLPALTGRPGRRWRDHRQVVEAICWKYRTGSPWRALPARFGPWQTAYERLTRWSADGTWARLLARARTDADAAGELDWLIAIDSTAVRVNEHAAGARRVGGKAATASPGEPEHGVAA
jgi:transposase